MSRCNPKTLLVTVINSNESYRGGQQIGWHDINFELHSLLISFDQMNYLIEHGASLHGLHPNEGSEPQVEDPPEPVNEEGVTLNERHRFTETIQK